MAEKQQTTQAEVDAHIAKRKKENIIWTAGTGIVVLVLFGSLLMAITAMGFAYAFNSKSDDKEIAKIYQDWDVEP